jgi:peptide/nickel transport system permease protein
MIVATIGTVVGVFIGLLSGFAGGFLDRVLMVVTDTFVVIPSLPILILMTSLMKGSSTVVLIALVLAMFAWAWPSRQIRSMALTLKERDFIQTARFSGEGTVQIVVTEILPFALTWSLSNFMNATLAAIASESSLAVLGLSPANLVSLGNMIQWARERNAIFNKQWLWIGSPIVATIVMFIGLFLLITGYNDYLAMKRGR